MSKNTLFAAVAGIAVAMGVGSTQPTFGQTLQIQFTGFDFKFANGNIYDVAAVDNETRSGDPANADALTTMSFYVDNVLQGTLSANIHADVFISGVRNLPVDRGVIITDPMGSKFGFDLLTQAGVPAFGLALDLNTIQIAFTKAGTVSFVFGGGVATSINKQKLPFDLQFDPNEPVAISFNSSRVLNVTTDGQYVTGFLASGTADVTGTVPEPAPLSLLSGLGALALWGWNRRRKAA